MMDTFVAEGNARLSDLLDRVERGERIVVTRRGKVIARLVAEGPAHGANETTIERILQRREAIRARLVSSSQPPITSSEISDWIDEGRR